MNVSPSASTSSFKSMENVVNSSTEEASHTTSILEDIPNEFLEHDNHTDPISTPSHESEELSGELRQLMNKNNQLPDIPTPLEDKYIEDSLSEIKINRDDNFWLTEDWQRKERHIFILSSSGKPVYSR
ncbi:hypothetical protein M8J75_010466 [Diaphorina citri]|nr:hypothetical protein M8J75_010466 [Diaphorina citri]